MSLDLKFVNEILNGNYDNTPDLKKKVVRIFLSSTFTDTNAERDYLIEKIYPRLKSYCRVNYDLDFQTVDMRWGIPSDAYEYHGTTELCLKEIRNCIEQSIGPNFVTLIGQKYGLRPLPTKIISDQFNLIISELDQDEDFSIVYEPKGSSTVFKLTNVLNECYKLDTNMSPSVFRLLPISKIIPTYVSPDPVLQEKSRKFWNKVQVKLSGLLRKGANRAYEKKLIDEVKRDRFFVSITEKEIFEGILNAADPNKTALCFTRNIENIEDNLTDSLIPRFIDVVKTEGCVNVDQEAKKLIDELKHSKIPKKLNESNIFNFNVKWKKNEIENIGVYLERFGNCFYDKIVRLIDDAINEQKQHDQSANQVYQYVGILKNLQIDFIDEQTTDLILEFKNFITELSHHAYEYNQTVSKFFGRDHLISKIKNYLFSDINFPFVVTGESGCGKTSVMGMTHQSIPNWFGKFTNYILITRFLGTTPQTSSIFKTYSSIALQLFYIINILTQKFNSTIYNSYKKCQDIISLRDLIYSQINQIYDIDPTKKIIILLDSLDQLTPNDYKTTDKWLLTNLSVNVKLVCSTIPDHGNLLEMIDRIIGKKFNDALINDMSSTSKTLSMSTSINIGSLYEKTKKFLTNQKLEVFALNPQESELILSNWLKACNKWLTDSQWNDLRLIFNKANLLPLFLKLIYDIVIHWRSFDDSDEQLKNCMVIDDIIIYMFKRMEKNHGHVIVRRCLSYMTVCKNGISDSELEDILSLDDDVLYSVFQFHMPPVRRIPQILWVRIKNDLSEYIVEKEANDTKVIYWYHRRFIEVSLEKYIKKLEKTENESILQNIFDFYNETWKDKQKPFELNEYLKIKLKKSTLKDQADRHISSQPIKYLTENNQVKYNKRKLTELPNCLANLNSHLALEKACELVFFNYEFMQGKFTCESINEVIQDLEKILENQSSFGTDNESRSLVLQLKYLQKCLNLCGWTINDNPSSLAFELTSRFLNHYGSFKYLTKFVDECDSKGFSDSSLVSPYLQNQPPGGYLISSISKHEEHIIDIFMVGGLVIIVSMNKIGFNMYNGFDQINFLFDVKIPMVKSSKEFRVKLLFELAQTDQDIFDKKIILPETILMNFLIIRNDVCFILDLNSKITFLYQSDLGILDAFCLGLDQLIIVEKGTKIIKVFPKYEIGSLKFNEILIGEINDSNFIKSVSSSNSSIESEQSIEIDLLCEFQNGDFKQLIIQYDNPKRRDSISQEEDEDDFISDNVTLRFDSDSESEYDSDSEVEKNVKFNQVNKTLKYSVVKIYRQPGLEINTILKIQNSNQNFFPIKKFNVTTSYVSFNNGDFLIINFSMRKKNRLLCYYFKQLCTEPVIKIDYSVRRGDDEFFLVLYTKNTVFLAHTNIKEVEYDKQKGMCLFDLKGTFDQVMYLNKNYYLVSKDGLIECFKINCVSNKHRTKLIFSINTMSKQITKMMLEEIILLCGTNDGTLNTFNVLNKSKVNEFTSFDRVYNKIDKLFIMESNALTISKKNEIALWSIKIGKIEASLSLKDHGLTGNLRKVKINRSQKLIYILMDNHQLAFFCYDSKKIEFINKINFSNKTYEKSNLFFLSEPESNHIDLIDLENQTIFKISFEPKNFNPIEIDDVNLNTKNTPENLLFYFTELNTLLAIDKNLSSFNDGDKQVPIRFFNSKDEKLIKKFFNLFGKANFKHKILAKTSTYFLSSITAYNSNMILNTLILNFKVISTNTKSNKSIELEIRNAYQGQKFKLAKNFLCLYTGCHIDPECVINPNELALTETIKSNKPNDRILIYNLSKDEVIFELGLNQKVNNFSIDTNMEYLAFTNDKKFLSLYRLKDSRLLSYFKLYGEDNGIDFNQTNRYVCLNMNDRRIFSLLLIDPDRPGHLDEIKDLRKSLMKNVKKESDDDDLELLDSDDESSYDDIDSTSDETGTDDEPTIEKSSAKEVKENPTDPRIKYHEKRVEFPIEIRNQRVDRSNWLVSYLEKLSKTETKSRESRINKSDDDNENDDDEDYYYHNKSDSVKNFGNELKAIMANNVNSSEPKLQNSGLHVRTANISSKACLIS